MSIFSSIFGKREGQEPEEPVAEILNGPGCFDLDAVGESFYQQALEEICGGRTEDSQRVEVIATLLLEDDNKYDKNAVLVTIEGLAVAHLDRETAKSFRKQLAKINPEIKKATCNAIIVGGWDRGRYDRGHFGVKLDLPIE